MRILRLSCFVFLLASCSPASRHAASSSGAASVGVSPPNAGAPLPPGEYWIRRTTGLSGSGGASLDGRPPAVTQHHETGCFPAEVGHGVRDREVRMGDAVVLQYRQEPEGWALTHASLSDTERAIRLGRACRFGLEIDGSATDQGHIRTTAGVFFVDAAHCEASPSSFTRTCRADECTDVDPLAMPVSFGACDTALSQIGTLHLHLVEATHQDLVTTLEQIERLFEDGGQVSTAVADVDPCLPVTVTPIEGGRVRFDRDYDLPDGSRVKSDTVLRFEPLFHRVRDMFTNEERFAPDGTFVGGGSTGSTTSRASVHIGARFFAIGPTSYYLEPDECRRHAPPGSGR